MTSKLLSRGYLFANASSSIDNRKVSKMAQPDDGRPPVYHSFMIRLWQEAPDAPWRVSVRSVETGEIVRFASLMALFSFMQEQTRRFGYTPFLPSSDQS